MADFTYSDVRVEPVVQYRVWCAACRAWVSEPADHSRAPHLRIVADVHRDRHARGLIR
jgi:hypothetical protein